MRVVIALVAVVAYAACQSVVYSTFVKPDVNKYCSRSVSVINVPYLITLQSTLGCASIKDNAQAAEGRYGVVGFQMSTALIPNYGIYGYGISGNASSGGGQGSAYLFGARFAVDTIVEYIETNNVAGYQPGQDTTVAAYSLSDLLRLTKWSAITNDVTKVGTTSVYRLTTQLKASGNVPFTVTYGAMVTSDEVVAGDATKVVLTPNSIKTVFDLQGFKYNSANTTSRMAIGTLLLSGGATSKWQSTPQSVAGDRPNEVSSRQGVTGLGGSASSSTGGFFSYQKFVVSSDSTASGKQVTLTASGDWTDESKTDVAKKTEEGSLTFKRMWFSVNDRVSNVNWDPTMGVGEKSENNVPQTNSASKVSMTIGVITFILTVLFL